MASATKRRSHLSLPIPSKQEAIFLTVWVAGMILGTFTATAASTPYFLLMRIAPKSNVSIVSLAVTVLLPFLFTAYAVYTDRILLRNSICFAKTFTVAFCSFGICAAYRSAGWLIRFLLQFSDICTMPVLCWLGMQNRRLRKVEIIRCGSMYLFVIGLDLWLVSPFLASIT